MAFRANEAARVKYEEAERYLVPRPRYADESQRERSRRRLEELIDLLGPAVDTYPTWHPLVSNHNNRHPVTLPGKQCGYNGLDHTRYFVHGFITCPYGDGQEVIDSVEAHPYNASPYDYPAARITAERLDVQFYNPNATPILVRCQWNESLSNGAISMDGMIP
jgi:hypothetical protein